MAAVFATLTALGVHKGVGWSRTGQLNLLLAHETPGSPEHGAEHHHPGSTTDAEHHHSAIEIPAGQPLPTVDLTVHPDPMRGWNLEVQVANFEFAPEELGQASRPTAGHAHLYINGEKITRLYGTWYYLDGLAPGRHNVTVSLNTNGHEALAHNGVPIEDSEILEVAVNDTLK